MKISVTIKEKTLGEKVMWAEKTDQNSFVCPKCQKREISIIYENGIPKKGLRCSNCKSRYRVNLTT